MFALKILHVDFTGYTVIKTLSISGPDKIIYHPLYYVWSWSWLETCATFLVKIEFLNIKLNFQYGSFIYAKNKLKE